jgi:excisionase family DNA binding protein
MQENLVTKKDICVLLNISRATLDRWRSKGLPSIKVDRAVRFDKEKVIEWVMREDEK